MQFGEQVADVPVMLVRSCGSSIRSSLSDGGFCSIFAAFFALRPHRRECPFFSPR